MLKKLSIEETFNFWFDRANLVLDHDISFQNLQNLADQKQVAAGCFMKGYLVKDQDRFRYIALGLPTGTLIIYRYKVAIDPGKVDWFTGVRFPSTFSERTQKFFGVYGPTVGGDVLDYLLGFPENDGVNINIGQALDDYHKLLNHK